MWYQQQLTNFVTLPKAGCDLLKNIYRCGINNNHAGTLHSSGTVVICLKISTFVVSTTTCRRLHPATGCCDLLKNIYLCGINNNYNIQMLMIGTVVICLKISTFVVSTTTRKWKYNSQTCCDLLKNIYLCGINNNAFLEVD